ncbi:hypothetical protein OSB04_015702 [Centaurea solstitialis]|uniref:Uncharacterized protein n=1 Tax=Centaurea solstitialis TaxID=347529 RepID=A0AA38W960_9ASTR|nr:hypothetical protein OSB04_015702 [Centaurea solstitialis]
MNRRIGKHSVAKTKSSDNGYLRYLRPGALAQLRDSKINARSNHHLRSSSSYRAISSSSSPTTSSSSPSGSPATSGDLQQPPPEAITSTFNLADGELPFVSARFYDYEPRCPQRKKLMAAKSIFQSTVTTLTI